MLINSILARVQNLLYPIYSQSFFLKNIDTLILCSIIAVIVVSAFAPSDCIAYFALGTVFLSLIKVATKPNEKFVLNLSDKFLLLYFIFVLISLAGSSLFIVSLKGFFKTVVYLTFYVSFVHFLKDNKSKFKYILLAFAFVVFNEAFIAIKQNFASVAEISGWQDLSRLNPEEIMTRVYGSVKPFNPNLFGGYILACLPTTLVLVFLPLVNKLYKVAFVGIMFFILGIITILMTGCRGAYLGLFVELLVLFGLTYHFLKPFYKKIFLLLTTIFYSLATFVIISISSLRARLFSIFAMRNDSSNSFRFNVYNSCIEMFKDNWLLGIGIGNQNFREIYGLYMKTGFDALSAYNIYLETAVESGIFALIFFIMCIISSLSKALSYIQKRKNVNSLYLVIAVISLSGILVHGFVDTVFFRPQIQIVFWIMLGTIRVFADSRGVNVKRRN